MNQTENRIIVFLFAITSLLFTSCEKVVDIDLNSSAPQTVIEGSITDQAGPYYVRITQTVNYSQTNEFPPISGASIVINDNAGNSETLVETLPGTYRTSAFQGFPGRTYTLTVKIGENIFIAKSTIPPAVNIDSLSIENQDFGRNKRKVVNVHFVDPGSGQNYYRFVEFKNGIEQKHIYLYDNRVKSSGKVTSSLFSNQDTLKTGDAVVISLQTIDKSVFDYFRTVRQASGGGGPNATSPANPTSNFSNGALGYFNACAVRSKAIFVP